MWITRKINRYTPEDPGGIGGALLGGVGPAGIFSGSGGISGAIGGMLNAPNDAASAQAQAAIQSAQIQTQAQKDMLASQQALSKPYVDYGTSAIQSMQQLMADPSKVTQQPGYQFGLQQGQQTVENSALARGMGLSGQTLQGLNQFGQNYAGQQFGNYFNQLQSMIGVGQSAAAGQSANVGQAMTNIGNIGAAQATSMGNIEAARIGANQQQMSSLLGTGLGIGMMALL